MKVLPGVECQHWYQILRPVGSTDVEKSRIEVLKFEDEPGIFLRDSTPRGVYRINTEKTFEYAGAGSIVAASDFTTTLSKDMVSNRDFQKGAGSKTYLPEHMKAFFNEDEEIRTVFRDQAIGANLVCPDDVDVEVIRATLAERQQLLGRSSVSSKNGDITDLLEGKDGKHGPANLFQNLLKTVDVMIAERTKPTPKKKDFFDKNRRIIGKVGFRRDEINGPREFTDRDEKLSLGDDDDVDFRPFLVAKGRGRFDSQGNFVLFDSPHEDGKTEASGVSSTDSKQSATKRAPTKNTTKMVDNTSSTISTNKHNLLGKAATDFLKQIAENHTLRKHPEWDFPMCNYPKWVHRMYRMDQVKIGHLIKQGRGTSEHLSPWEMYDSHSVRGTQGKQSSHPSNVKRMRSHVGKLTGHSNKISIGGRKTERVTSDMQREITIGGKSGDVSVAGMSDFLEGFRNYVGSTSRSDSEDKRSREGSYNIDDKIKMYQDRENNVLRGDLGKYGGRHDVERMKKLQQMQDDALKRVAAMTEKYLQDQQQMDLERAESEAKVHRKSREQSGSKGIKGIYKGNKDAKGTGSNAESRRLSQVCSNRKTTLEQRSPIMDEECRRRFRILLKQENSNLRGQEFQELAKQIPMFNYNDPKPPKKTPCDRVEIPIC